MKILCRRISEIQICKADKFGNKEFDLYYLKIIIELMQMDEFLHAWLSSESFFEDLENLYFIHLPSKTDWDALL